MFVSVDQGDSRRSSCLSRDSGRAALGYGRFMQADPLGYDDGMNWYAYVKNDPVNAIDPTGLVKTCTGSRVKRGEDFDCNSMFAGTGPAPPTVGFDATFRGDAGSPTRGLSDGFRSEGRARDSACSGGSDEIVVCASSKEIKRRCIDACYPILERWQPPGSDRNRWDFEKCVKLCVAEAEEERKKYQYVPPPDTKPKPFWHPYPRPWWFWWPPVIPKRTQD